MNRPRVAKSARHADDSLSIEREEALLDTHRLHLGLYRRVADRLGIDASYVSKVASGTRKCDSVKRILLSELLAVQQ